MSFLAGRALPSAWRSPTAVFAVAVAALLSAMAVCAGVAAAATTDPILVYSGNTSMAPAQTYASVGAVSERPISSTTVLPGSLAGNACVLLNLNQSTFSGSQVATLSNYLVGGGRVVMVGENDNYVNNAPFRSLATALGSSLQIQNTSLDPGFRDTLNIDADPLTRDVVSVNYAATASVTFSAPARSLVRTSGGGATMIAAETIGTGELIALGDANAFTSVAGSAGVLVANICGSRRETTSAVDCIPASALVGDTVTCAAIVTDNDTGPADTPTGDVRYGQSSAGAGTFANGGACTLAPTGTLGEASCTVTYTATAAGAQTLTGAYAGSNQSFSSSGSDAHAATLPAPPVATGGQATAAYGQPQTFRVAIPAGGSVALLDSGQPVTSVSFAGEGVYALDASTGLITFTPAAGFSGTARGVSYRITDSYGQFSDASFVATVSAPPATPAGTPAPTAAPSVCASRRLLSVHFRVPARTEVRSVRVTIAGKARRLPATSRQLTVDLRGMGPRGVRVVIAATVAGGKTMSAVRAYRTCATVRSASALKTLLLRDARRTS